MYDGDQSIPNNLKFFMCSISSPFTNNVHDRLSDYLPLGLYNINFILIHLTSDYLMHAHAT